MSGEDEKMWWVDEGESGDEEYVEYFDTRIGRWVPKHMVEGYEAGQSLGEDAPSPGPQGHAGSGDEGGWAVFDTDSPAESLLRGRGEVRRRGVQPQPATGLKLYLILSSVMAGLLAASGRFLELGIVGASIAIVLAAWRWRGGWA